MADATSPLRFGNDGLVSAAIQDARTGQLLMVGFMNRDAVEATRSTGFVHFWSRSRQKLWKKGESSGHVQRVEEIRVNCEQNSLLIEVEQAGAVCHDGYDTCYYRRLEPDNTLTIVRDRQFDPRDVYGDASAAPAGLAGLTRQWWAVFEMLRDQELESQSSTSHRLRSPKDENTPRIADELRELAGVLDGSHRHQSLDEDVRLEAGQVLYWIAASAVYHRLSWDDVRPDLALSIPTTDPVEPTLLARLITARAGELASRSQPPDASQLHDTITLVASVVMGRGVEPEELIQQDVDDMSAKPYLSPLFTNR